MRAKPRSPRVRRGCPADCCGFGVGWFYKSHQGWTRGRILDFTAFPAPFSLSQGCLPAPPLGIWPDSSTSHLQFSSALAPELHSAAQTSLPPSCLPVFPHLCLRPCPQVWADYSDTFLSLAMLIHPSSWLLPSSLPSLASFVTLPELSPDSPLDLSLPVPSAVLPIPCTPSSQPPPLPSAGKRGSESV